MSSRSGERTWSWRAAHRGSRGASLSGARLVVAASTALAETARLLGAREVRVIPSGVDLPLEVGEEAEPPEILYAGRLSAEKGVLELVEAASGLNLVVAGDGPLRDRVPGTRGFVPHDELQELYARADHRCVSVQARGLRRRVPGGHGTRPPRRRN